VFKVNNAADMQQALEKMTEDQREHLRIVITELIQCYLDDDTHGMVLVGKAPYNRFAIMAVNTNELDAAELLGAANTYVQESVMYDAPPKEKFN